MPYLLLRHTVAGSLGTQGYWQIEEFRRYRGGGGVRKTTSKAAGGSLERVMHLDAKQLPEPILGTHCRLESGP
jgi:hypothetical protein